MTHKTSPQRRGTRRHRLEDSRSICRTTRGISFAELGRKVGLSTPAVAERVRRLEEAGVITGYHASVDMAKLGRADSCADPADHSRRRPADHAAP